MNQIAINDIGTAEDFMAAIDQSMKNYKSGDMVKGQVVQISREGVLVDIGYKTEGYLPMSEISSEKDFDVNDFVQIGQELEAKVLYKNNEFDQYILSIKNGYIEKIWNDLQNYYEISHPIIGKVKKIVKGGLIVDIGVKAFLPGSQIEIGRVDDMSGYLGQEYDFLIIQIDRNKENIVLSRRALLEQINKEDKQIEFSKMAKGQVHKAIVSGVEKYGAFVQVGLISGLIHISKMNNKTLEIGQQVDVEIIDLDLDKSRLSLALRG